MNHPSDQPARGRFAFELDRNFSVVASAGSGKTRAITDRIVALAKSGHALEWLPQLIVVTYTNRAANEMQQRARQEILKARVDVDVIAAFNRAFFGTIHSFCVKLLTAYGHYIGLPPQMELIDDDEELWNDFVQRQQSIGHSLPENARRILFRHIEIRKLMELGRRSRIGEAKPFIDEPCPVLDVTRLLAFRTTHKGSIEAVGRTQASLREFERLCRNGAEFVPLPMRESKLLAELWSEAFDPFRNWLNRAALTVAAEVEQAYRDFRLTRGVFTYDDQVALAYGLFRHPEAARRIREKNYRVILDEAQDTAPLQFAVLLESVRPAKAASSWPNESENPPRPGHFSMVGDFQQSIFGSHADLPNYKRIHDALIAAGGEALEFSVTFRLDEKNLELINENFRTLLSGERDQVKFVELSPRPSILPGQIIRLDLGLPAGLPADAPERRKAGFEARALARWIRNAGLRNLRAKTWSDVAVLCPRKAWFQPLRQALRHEKFEVQIQSENEWKGDNPAYAWLTALLTITTQPHCSYETVGVLREVFGISDHDLATYSGGKGARFDLRQGFAADDVVTTKLKLLAQIQHSIQSLPLFTAVKELIETVQLRERLRILPSENFPNIDEELDRLLALAATAEAEGSNLSDFAKHLRADFSAQREPPAAEERAIQLITEHKAKGSEWQAVIVPFLAREVFFPGDVFPRLLPGSIIGQPLVALNRDDIAGEIEEAMERMRTHEMERLLYVALTRAKHTLVLVSDLALFARKSGRPPSKSQMTWLRCASGGCNEENFTRLSTEAKACNETEARRASDEEAGRTTAPISSLKWTPQLRAKMEEHAQDFVRKINPSAFEETFPLERQPESGISRSVAVRAGALDNAATLYGHWWHQLLQQLPWSNEETWQEKVKAALRDAPDAKRAEKEWKLLRAWACSHGALSPWHDGALVCAPTERGDYNTRTEMPFLLKIKRSLALEGIIDLALIDAQKQRALIVDWKTNQVSRKKSAGLRERYRPQIAAYWKAMTEITGFNVSAGIYSTATGMFLLYDTAELDREWRRLEKLPLDHVMEEVSLD